MITWDWEKVGQLAAKLFIERNHKRIGYTASIRYKVSEAYEKGFKRTLQEHGIDLPDDNIYYGTSSHRSMETEYEKIEFITTLLSRPDRPTAIFCNDASSEVLLLIMAQKMNIKIPEELSLIRFGTAPHDYNMGNVVSSLYVEHKKIGNLAMQVLSEIQTNKRSMDNNEIIHVPIKFNEGETLMSL